MERGNLGQKMLLAHENWIVNRQLKVGDSKYVVVCDPLHTGLVTQHMCSGHFGL